MSQIRPTGRCGRTGSLSSRARRSPASRPARRRLADQPPDGSHQLLNLRLAWTLAPAHAVADVLVQQPQGDLVERRLGGLDLGEDVDAVALLLDHPRDAPDLPLDPGEPG